MTTTSKPRPLVFIEDVGEYVKGGGSLDMVMKSAVGVTRLLSIYASTAEARASYVEVTDSIVETRMLSNHWRYATSMLNAHRLLTHPTPLPYEEWFFTFLSCAFRTLEQVHGDLSYYQKVMIPSWSRERLSFGYRFWKSLSLTCTAFVEIFRILRLRRSIAKARKQAGALEMSTEEVSPPDPRANVGLESDKTPSTVLEKGVVIKAGESLIVSETVLVKQKKHAIIGLIRCLCDMAVYYKWVSWYNPYKTVEYGAGLISGVLGVCVIWVEQQNAKKIDNGASKK